MIGTAYKVASATMIAFHLMQVVLPEYRHTSNLVDLSTGFVLIEFGVWCVFALVFALQYLLPDDDKFKQGFKRLIASVDTSDTSLRVKWMRVGWCAATAFTGSWWLFSISMVAVLIRLLLICVDKITEHEVEVGSE